MKILKYVTRHLGRRLLSRPTMSVITKPSTCHALPTLLTKMSRNRGRVGAMLSVGRACSSVLPMHTSGDDVAAFMSVVHKYGGVYACYVIPCMEKTRHDHSPRSVMRRVERLRTRKCGRMYLLNRGISSCF